MVLLINYLPPKKNNLQKKTPLLRHFCWNKKTHQGGEFRRMVETHHYENWWHANGSLKSGLNGSINWQSTWKPKIHGIRSGLFNSKDRNIRIKDLLEVEEGTKRKHIDLYCSHTGCAIQDDANQHELNHLWGSCCGYVQQNLALMGRNNVSIHNQYIQRKTTFFQ